MKIGIVTLYYNSTNYGGVLQAYALCKALNQLGYQAEQIQLDVRGTSLNNDLPNSSTAFAKALHFIKKVKNFLQCRLTRFFKKRAIARVGEEINTTFENFRTITTPHSEVVYNKENIAECEKKYDAFITGSDQVWNPDWYHPAYFLSFVSSKKNKIAYAASVGKAELTNKQKKIFKEHLADFCGISVREESALQMVKEISPVKAEWVLDPTLLLSREEWDEICAPRAVDGKYVFCYFLGVDKNQEKTASDFAKKNNLKLTVIRNFQSSYLNDADKLQNVSPEKFVSLIKHAEYVFTDSFHATVFSNIYNKEYFVFERAGHKGMNSRIYSLIKLFGNEERFCDIPEKATLAYVEKIPKLSVANSSYFNKVKEESFNFLKRNLNKVKETIEKNEG